jgi:hypothetical protein
VIIDYSALLFDPAFGQLGVPATMNGIAITVIDETRQKQQTSNSVDVHSVGPAAVARIPELTANGIMRDAYKGSSLIFNGRTWEVRHYDISGSPNGEDAGLVHFLLMATT